MAQNFFYFLAALTLLSAFMVIVSKNPIHSVLYGILTFFTLSGHYILLNAQFLAAVNIIVYAGAIMVLFVFTIMFLNLRTDTEPPKTNLLKLATFVAGGMLIAVFSAVVRQSGETLKGTKIPDSQIGLVETLGKTLFNDFLLPFELASVLFLVAIVGAVMIGQKEKRYTTKATLVGTEKLYETKKLDTKEANLLNQ
ncbi:MAG: NADH-quinone oxidoreductase subunit J [Verrucomicrobia bacterium]|nr:NADH-quinone oxidoreductase subunit J [Cytophagales bacterium]